MKYLLALSLLSLNLAYGETPKEETVKTINKGASNIDAETRKIIGAGKDVFSGKKKIKKNTKDK